MKKKSEAINYFKKFKIKVENETENTMRVPKRIEAVNLLLMNFIIFFNIMEWWDTLWHHTRHNKMML